MHYYCTYVHYILYQVNRVFCLESAIKLGRLLLILRATIVNRTYGTYKKLYIYLFLRTISGPIYSGPFKAKTAVPFFGEKHLFFFEVVCPQNGTAVLKWLVITPPRLHELPLWVRKKKNVWR